jgi:hypothetical protein
MMLYYTEQISSPMAAPPVAPIWQTALWGRPAAKGANDSLLTFNTLVWFAHRAEL